MSADRGYHGPLRGVIFDWAGTIVDYGSRAPAGVFMEVFRRRDVPITMAQARGPMGMHKRDHIVAILRMPPVASIWRDHHGRDATDEDVDSMYASLIELQLACLRDYAQLIPGVLETVAACRARGMKIGSTTGYNRAMLDVLLDEAKRQGFVPDAAMCSDDVPAGRPHPYMAQRAAIEMQVYPPEALVKVGDTVPDIDEGRNAGMWTVGVTKTGNELGLPEADVAGLSAGELAGRLSAAEQKLSGAGAHYIIEGVSALLPVLDQIDRRLAAGERP